MKREGVYEGVKNKIVLGENISQAAAFVVSGSADVGIVFPTLLHTIRDGPRDRLRWGLWDVDTMSHIGVRFSETGLLGDHTCCGKYAAKLRYGVLTERRNRESLCNRMNWLGGGNVRSHPESLALLALGGCGRHIGLT